MHILFNDSDVVGHRNRSSLVGPAEDYEQLLIRNDCLRLAQDVALFGAGHEFTKLCPSLKGVDPDDAFSGIPYVKGQVMLLYLESLVGQERFEAYLRAHVQRFKGGCLDQDDFKSFFLEHFAMERLG